MTEVSLTIDEYYVVYAMQVSRGWCRYFVADDDYGGARSYPAAYLPAFFDVVDARASRYWVIWQSSKMQQNADLIIACNKWATDVFFYEKLVNGDKSAQNLFETWKEAMDLEFANPTIKDQALMLKGKWLQCPRCDEAWESSLANCMVRCPSCQTILLDPMHLNDEPIVGTR